MSKTLYSLSNLPQREVDLIFKFAAIASFCGKENNATYHVSQGKTLHLEATIRKPLPVVEFHLVLEEIGWEALRITQVSVSDGLIGKMLDPEVVVADMGLSMSIEKGWRVHNPSELEAFLRKYAWLSKLYQTRPLFEKLLEYR